MSGSGSELFTIFMVCIAFGLCLVLQRYMTHQMLLSFAHQIDESENRIVQHINAKVEHLQAVLQAPPLHGHGSSGSNSNTGRWPAHLVRPVCASPPCSPPSCDLRAALVGALDQRRLYER